MKRGDFRHVLESDTEYDLEHLGCKEFSNKKELQYMAKYLKRISFFSKCSMRMLKEV